MQLTYTNKFVVFAATLVFAFGAAITAFAYDALDIEIDIYDDYSKVEVSYEDDGDGVVKKYTFSATDLDEIYALVAAKLSISEEDVEDAVSDVDDHNGDGDKAMEDAEDAMEDAETAIAKAEAYIATLDEDEASTTIAELEEDLADAKAALTDAENAFEDSEYGQAEQYADDAEDIAKKIYEDEEDEHDEDEEEDDDSKDRSKFCENTKKAAGWGVAKKCVDEDGYEINDKLASKVDKAATKYSDYGKSTDQTELQNQLRELLTLLIQLLQQQRAMQSDS